MIAVLAHPLGIIFKVGMLALADLFTVSGQKLGLVSLLVYFSDNEN